MTTPQLLRPVYSADIVTVIDQMRLADKAECFACAGMGPELGLLLSLNNSVVSVTMLTPDGALAGIAGVSKDNQIWMLGTTSIERFPVTFIRQSRPWVEQQTEVFGTLHNWVDARNTLHVKWLKSIGVQFIGERVSPYTGTPLLHFIKAPPQCV